MIDLVRIPFIRSNQTFKQFLDMDQNYLEDELYDRRTAF